MTNKLKKIIFKNLIAFLTSIFLISTCYGGIFKPGRMTNVIKYSYRYEANQLKYHIEESKTKLFGITIDSYTEKINYLYNENGLLIKKVAQNDFQDKPTIHVFGYNENDSLILELVIDHEGDTTIWSEYEYYPDGRKMVFHKEIWPKFNLSSFNAEKEYDTILSKYEYDYADNKCKTMKLNNKEDKTIKSIDYKYLENRLVKEVNYGYLNSKKTIEKTKFYDYSNLENHPDYYILDTRNDTVELRISQLKDESQIYTVEQFTTDAMEHKIYYINGKEIEAIEVDKRWNYKYIHTYKYYKSGDLKRVRTKYKKHN